MGDQFKQNRSLRTKQNSYGNDNPQTLNRSNSTGSNSFLEIQQEQERESFSNRTNGTNDARRGTRESPRGTVGGIKDLHRGQRRNTFHRSAPPNLQDMPLEQGRVHTLLDNFGFIYCADRPTEIFFHYSEFAGNSNDLNVGDEVEFYVGQAAKTRGGRTDQAEEKLSAYGVKPLEPGSVQWEIEDEPIGSRWRGKVERVSRVYARERDRGGSNEGTIRLILDADADIHTDTHTHTHVDDHTPEATHKIGSLLRYTATNYNGDGSHSRLNGNGFARNDVVEFTIVTDKRSGLKHARNITMIQSEHARLEEEQEKTMLESATLEQGTVVTLKENFGFLRSNKRKEEVYFHYSHIVLPEVDCDNDHTLTEGQDIVELGQDMEFLVVTEQDGDRRKKYSGRRVKFLKKGSVVFQQVLAQGVTGVISKSPSPSVLLSGGRNRRVSSGISGIVRLDSSIKFQPAEDSKAEIEVAEVILLPDDSPGGSFPAHRDGSRVGMWVREGDTLLFDVVRDAVDGKCRAAPTKYQRPLCASMNKSNTAHEEGTEKGATCDGDEKVRMISASLGGRSEGIISSIKDNYGFIQLAERNADAYFRLNDVLPLELQTGMMMNADPRVRTDNWKLGEQPKLDIGCEVSLDLSLQPPQLNNFGGRGYNSRQQNDKEQVRAQRLAFLAPSSVKLARTIAFGCRATVVKESPRLKGTGQLELEDKVDGLTMRERYPITSRLVEHVRSKGEGFSSSFHDAQSEKELQVIKEMVALEDELELRNVPVSIGDSGEQRNFTRIIIVNVGKRNVEAEPHAVALCTEVTKVANNSSGAEGSKTNPSPNLPPKKLKTKVKSVKTISFENLSLSSEFEGLPLGKGDKVTCDIIQCCRSGTFSGSNIKLIERNPRVQDTMSLKVETKSGMGFVLEAAESRQCGRISIYEENSSKRQVLTFLYTDVSFTPPPIGEIISKESRTIQKGDEVKFNIIRAGDRKLLAKNVLVIPQGTIDTSKKLDKNQCQGYILMGPSHTSLAHKQSPTLSKGTEGGRWSNCVHEGKSKQSDETIMSGRILLVSDPGHSFDSSKGEVTEARSDPGNTESAQSSSKNLKLETSSMMPRDTVKDANSLSSKETSVLYSHLSYSVASNRGRGASSKTLSPDTPKRGDLVSFSKGKGGKVRDICVIKPNAATSMSGTLVDINSGAGTANFCSSADKQHLYQIQLTEVVSCEVALLKEKEIVEGILYDGKVFGVCRTADLYLKSTLRSGLKERPRLNLTVKRELKDLGGKIIAQSGMAKGPDGTIGFALGWTKRICRFSQTTEESTLDINSREFYPTSTANVKTNDELVLESERDS